MKISFLFGIFGIATTLALPIAASAQQTAPADTASAPTLSGRVEQRLAQLHTELAVTPAEDALWGQYAQVTRSNARAMATLFAQRRAAMPTMNAAQNIQSMAGIAAQHAQDMERLNTAFAALYAAMPPDQQKTADAALRAHTMRGHAS